MIFNVCRIDKAQAAVSIRNLIGWRSDVGQTTVSLTLKRDKDIINNLGLFCYLKPVIEWKCAIPIRHSGEKNGELRDIYGLK